MLKQVPFVFNNGQNQYCHNDQDKISVSFADCGYMDIQILQSNDNIGRMRLARRTKP